MKHPMAKLARVHVRLRPADGRKMCAARGGLRLDAGKTANALRVVAMRDRESRVREGRHDEIAPSDTDCIGHLWQSLSLPCIAAAEWPARRSRCAVQLLAARCPIPDDSSYAPARSRRAIAMARGCRKMRKERESGDGSVVHLTVSRIGGSAGVRRRWRSSGCAASAGCGSRSLTAIPTVRRLCLVA
jgi:hypothetical protein